MISWITYEMWVHFEINDKKKKVGLLYGLQYGTITVS